MSLIIKLIDKEKSMKKTISLIFISLLTFNVFGQVEKETNTSIGTGSHNRQIIQICKPVVKYVESTKKCNVPKTKIIYVKKPVIKYKTKIVIKEKIVEKVVVVKEKLLKNSLSLLVGISATELDLNTNGNTDKAKTEHESDLGLMYQRELSKKFRATAIGTINGNFYLGGGFKF